MNLTAYIKGTRAELKHVNWSSRQQIIAYTAVVIVFSLVIASLLGLADLVFNSILRLVI